MDDDQKKCGGLSLFGLVVIGMSVAAIVIGCLNINTEDIQLSNVAQPDQISSNCSVEPRIPYYLIVAGVLMLVLLILRLFFQKCCGKLGECGEDNACCNTINAICKFSAATFFDLIALALVVAWLIVGTIWVFNVWNKVQTETEAGADYCPSVVYNFAAALVIWQWINVAFMVICGLLCRFCACFFGLLCCKPCKEADENQTV